ncbi:substrate-binding periplasmic protein [Litoribacillus peritrichatus]|uniref:Transporter substrate-binding domain-containing protein n=1 Tax=Litoribacillus peritrichatus TaxID=718191 RepID=A0ABP7MUA3_9GAMM
MSINYGAASMLSRPVLVFFFSLLFSICQAETYHFASGEFPPFTGEAVKNGGLATEIVVSVVQDMGDQSEVNFLPWKRGYKQTQEGLYLGTFAYSKNKERVKEWFYSEPLYTLKEVFIVQRGSNIHYQSDYDLRGKNVCKPQGYNLFRLKKLAEKGIIIIDQPPNMKHCFRMLGAGRVDMVMTNSETAEALIQSEADNPTEYKILETPFTTIGHHLIIPRTNKAGENFLKRFNRVLNTYKHDGKIDAMIQNYF